MVHDIAAPFIQMYTGTPILFVIIGLATVHDEYGVEYESESGQYNL